MHILAFVLTLLGAILVYLSHQNQILLMQKLSPSWQRVGWGSCLLGLLSFCWQLSLSVAIFSWCTSMMFIWTFLPFMGLLKRDPQHES